MRIDPSSIQPPSIRTPAGGTVRPAATEPASSAAEADGFEPTGELARLLALVHEAPEVRVELMHAVAERLASGELNTSAAAMETAEAMFDSGAAGSD
jgi:hypothetical protein